MWVSPPIIPPYNFECYVQHVASSIFSRKQLLKIWNSAHRPNVNIISTPPPWKMITILLISCLSDHYSFHINIEEALSICIVTLEDGLLIAHCPADFNPFDHLTRLLLRVTQRIHLMHHRFWPREDGYPPEPSLGKKFNVGSWLSLQRIGAITLVVIQDSTYLKAN